MLRISCPNDYQEGATHTQTQFVSEVVFECLPTEKVNVVFSLHHVFDLPVVTWTAVLIIRIILWNILQGPAWSVGHNICFIYYDTLVSRGWTYLVFFKCF